MEFSGITVRLWPCWELWLSCTTYVCPRSRFSELGCVMELASLMRLCASKTDQDFDVSRFSSWVLQTLFDWVVQSSAVGKLLCLISRSCVWILPFPAAEHVHEQYIQNKCCGCRLNPRESRFYWYVVLIFSIHAFGSFFVYWAGVSCRLLQWKQQPGHWIYFEFSKSEPKLGFPADLWTNQTV